MKNLWQRIVAKVKHYEWHVSTFTPEMWEWALAAGLLLMLIWWKNPQQVPVLMFKACQFCASVYIAHVLDRSFFPHKEDEPRDIVMAAKEIARMGVFVGTVLALTLGMA